MITLEKEAKERARDYTSNKERQVAYECGFLDGIDRAKEELKEKLAGLKAGRPKWHKVADGDLPKETGEYLTNIGVLIWDYYADGRYGWHTENCEFCDCCADVDSDEIIAWCEKPKYEEE